MDCNEVQAYLSLRTLGHDQATGPKLLAAKRHLAECSSCQSAFEAERHFDRDVAREMSDIALPAGMKDRLKMAVEQSVDHPATLAASGGGAWGRRAALGLMAASIPLVVWMWMNSSALVIAESDLQQLAERPLESTSSSSTISFPIPVGWDRVRGVQFGESALHAAVGKREIPILPIRVRLRARSPEVTGLLIRVSRIQGHPIEATSLGTATIQYASFGSWAAWREGNVIYICVLRDTHVMERLRNALDESRELT